MMKTIAINLSDFTDLKKLSWILYAFLLKIDYAVSKSEVVNIWNDLIEGKTYVFNPYGVFMCDDTLFITNKNDCSTHTSNFLVQFEVELLNEIDGYNDSLLSAYETMTNLEQS